MNHTVVACLVAAAAACVPALAQAQFVVTAQSGAVSASSSSGASAQQVSVPGDLTNLTLSVSSGVQASSVGGAASRTTLESGRVGLYAGVSAMVNGAASGGNGVSGGYSGGTYYGGSSGGFIPGSASAKATVSINFDVTQSIDVQMSVTDLYRPSNIKNYFPTFSSALNFEQQDGSGSWVSVINRDALGTVAHLDAGHYRLNADFTYNITGTSGLAGGGASVLITAVPEPTTWSLMALGMMGLGLATRRAQRSA